MSKPTSPTNASIGGAFASVVTRASAADNNNAAVTSTPSGVSGTSSMSPRVRPPPPAPFDEPIGPSMREHDSARRIQSLARGRAARFAAKEALKAKMLAEMMMAAEDETQQHDARGDQPTDSDTHEQHTMVHFPPPMNSSTSSSSLRSSTSSGLSESSSSAPSSSLSATSALTLEPVLRASYTPNKKPDVPRLAVQSSRGRKDQTVRRTLPLAHAHPHHTARSTRPSPSHPILPSIRSITARSGSNSRALIQKVPSQKLFAADPRRLPPSVRALQAKEERSKHSDSSTSIGTDTYPPLHHSPSISLYSDLIVNIESNVRRNPRYNRAQPYPPVSTINAAGLAISPYGSTSTKSLRSIGRSSQHGSSRHLLHSGSTLLPTAIVPTATTTLYLNALPSASASSAVDPRSEAGFEAARLAEKGEDASAKHIEFRKRFNAKHALPKAPDYHESTQLEAQSRQSRSWRTIEKQDASGRPTAWFTSKQGQLWQQVRSANSTYETKRSALLRVNSTLNTRLSDAVENEAAALTRPIRLINDYMTAQRKEQDQRMIQRYEGRDSEAEAEAQAQTEPDEVDEEKQPWNGSDQPLRMLQPYAPSNVPSYRASTNLAEWSAWEIKHGSHLERNRAAAREANANARARDQYESIHRDASVRRILPPSASGGTGHASSNARTGKKHPYASPLAIGGGAGNSVFKPSPSSSELLSLPPGNHTALIEEIKHLYAQMCEEFVEIRQGEETPNEIDPSLIEVIRTTVKHSFGTSTSPGASKELDCLSDAQIKQLMVRASTGARYTLPRLQELAMVRGPSSTTPAEDDASEDSDTDPPLRSLNDLIEATRAWHVELDSVTLAHYEDELLKLLAPLSDSELLRSFKAPPQADLRRFEFLWALRTKALEKRRKGKEAARGGNGGTNANKYVQSLLQDRREERERSMRSKKVGVTLYQDAADVQPTDASTDPDESVDIFTSQPRMKIVGYASRGGASLAGTAKRKNTKPTAPAAIMPDEQEERKEASAAPESNPFVLSLYEYLSDWSTHGLIVVDDSPVSPARPTSSMRLSASAAVVSSLAVPPPSLTGNITTSYSSASLPEVDATTIAIDGHPHPSDTTSSASSTGISRKPRFTVSMYQARSLFEILPREHCVQLYLTSLSQAIRTDPDSTIPPFSSFDAMVSHVRSTLISNPDLYRSLSYLLDFLNSPAPSMLCIGGDGDSRVLLSRDDLYAFFSRLNLPLVHSSFALLLDLFRSFSGAAFTRRFQSIHELIYAIEVDRCLNPESIAKFFNTKEGEDACVLFETPTQVNGLPPVDWNADAVRRLLLASGRQITSPSTLTFLRTLNRRALVAHHPIVGAHELRRTGSQTIVYPPNAADSLLEQLEQMQQEDQSKARTS